LRIQLPEVVKGGPRRLVGLDIPSGHSITASDVAAVDRAMIRFHPQAAPMP